MICQHGAIGTAARSRKALVGDGGYIDVERGIGNHGVERVNFAWFDNMMRLDWRTQCDSLTERGKQEALCPCRAGTATTKADIK